MRASAEVIIVRDAPSGLVAAIVLDSETLGPAAGGIRTRTYPDLAGAIEDARALASAMTLKCALAGLAAGGGKGVVLDHPGLDRPRAFRILGTRIQALGGRFRTAGDLGTGPEDLAAMASVCEYVHTDEPNLAASVARGTLRCMEAIARVGGKSLPSLSVGIQGCGAIGAALARTLVPLGMEVVVADVDAARAHKLALATGVTVVRPDQILMANVDIMAPCAVGGVITQQVAREMPAWALCGAANNIVADVDAQNALAERAVLWVPDVVASAGAVADGIGRSVMGLAQREPLIDALGPLAERVLKEARERGISAQAVAEAIGRSRLIPAEGVA